MSLFLKGRFILCLFNKLIRDYRVRGGVTEVDFGIAGPVTEILLLLLLLLLMVLLLLMLFLASQNQIALMVLASGMTVAVAVSVAIPRVAKTLKFRRNPKNRRGR